MAWQIEMVAKRSLSIFGGLGISHQIGAATLNAAQLSLGCRVAARALPVLALPA